MSHDIRIFKYLGVGLVCLVGFTAGMCEQEPTVVANICKGKSEVACMQDAHCKWAAPDEGEPKCKEAD
jgi:hypothetical protein